MDKLRVLIAEDREELRATIIELLRAEFTVVGDVGDGQKLVETASSLKPDIIVSDIDLPLLDGFSAMRILRTKGIEAPFVFITSMAVEGPSSAVEDHPGRSERSGALAEPRGVNESKIVLGSMRR